jgi:photosynthetic reaction center H subunit
MQTGAITTYIDVAQLTLYAFWIFFAGLILYLRREDRREGYPLVTEGPEHEPIPDYGAIPKPKTFLLPGGKIVLAPREEPPYVPPALTGNPMLDGLGAAAYANRADEPDHMYGSGLPKIVPLRAAPDFFLDPEDPDPRGWTVVGADGVVAGSIAETWVDRAEMLVRYLEVTLEGGGSVLLPFSFAEMSSRQQRIDVPAILAAQFADVPKLRSPDQVTLLEEDRITAYYAGGLLFATPERSEPLL